MSIFDRAVSDIFSCPDLTEDVVIGGSSCRGIVHDTASDPVYTQWGLDQGVKTSVSLRKEGLPELKKGMSVTFRAKTWRIRDFYTDSFDLCVTIGLGD